MKSALLVAMTPILFLRLTTSSQTEVVELCNTIRDVPLKDYHSGSHATYNVNKYSVPWLNVELSTGKVRRFDGRHRAARMLNADKSAEMPVMIHFVRSAYIITWSTVVPENGVNAHTNHARTCTSLDEASKLYSELSAAKSKLDVEILDKIDILQGYPVKTDNTMVSQRPFTCNDLPSRLLNCMDSNIVVPTIGMKCTVVGG